MATMFSRIRALLALLALVASSAMANDNATIMVFDASGSMWNRMDGEITRIEVARDVMQEFFAGRDASRPVSVIAYGHRRRGDCGDIEVIASLGTHDPNELASRLKALNPQGMTPLTDSLALARDQIPATTESADIILVTDGLENCGGDPCAFASRLASEGIAIRAHVVGFGMSADEVNSLSCVPDQTGGMLFQTNSGAELAEALTAVSTPEPQPAELEFRAVDARNGRPLSPVDWRVVDSGTDTPVVTANDEAMLGVVLTAGAYRVAATHPGFEGSIEVAVEDGMTGVIDVPLQKILATVTLEGVNAQSGAAVADVNWTWSGPDGDPGESVPVTLASSRFLMEPGEYRVEGVAGVLSGDTRVEAILEEDRTIRVALSESLPDATVAAPDEIPAGAEFLVEWTGPDDGNDYITIVESGAPEGTYADYARTRSGSPAKVTAPDALGAYEVRYVHASSARTLASQGVTLTGVEASLDAPDEVFAGSEVSVVWEGPNNPNDYITVVEKGAPEGTYNDYARTRSGSPAKVTTPDALGAYELRYVLAQSGRTLTSRPLTLKATSASLDAPDEVFAGSEVSVVWEGPNNPNDYITVVEKGAPEGTYNDYARTRSGSPAKVTTPDALGAHELRYVLAQSGRTLTSRPLTLKATSASLEDPGMVVPGGSFEVVWDGPDNSNDYITIVESGAAEGSYTNYWRTRRGSPAKLQAPGSEGNYELRYVIAQSGRTLASLPVEVGAGEVSLSVVGEVSAGGAVTVEWTGPGRYEDFIQIVDEGSADDASPIREARASQGSPLQLFAPSAAGSYEIRYRASDSGEVLARTTLIVND